MPLLSAVIRHENLGNDHENRGFLALARLNSFSWNTGGEPACLENDYARAR